MRYTNCVCIVVGVTVALERTLVMVDYEDKRKSRCIAPDEMLVFHVKIIVVASSVAALGQDEENPIFDPC